MKCPYCEKEYSDQSQQICEFCGSELAQIQSTQQARDGSVFNQFLEDSGLRGLFKKIKDNIKENLNK